MFLKQWTVGELKVGLISIKSILFIVLGLVSAQASAAGLPCDEGFEFNAILFPVQGTASWSASGLKIKYQKQRGTVTRAPSSETSEFDKTQCLEWQKSHWPVFKRVLLENQRAERESVACRSIAMVEYTIGKKKNQKRLCLADPRTDGLSRGFKRFYEGSDSLIAK